MLSESPIVRERQLAEAIALSNIEQCDEKKVGALDQADGCF
jgi:hypothetical protein